MRNEEQNEQINDLFKQAVKALDERYEDPDSEVDPLVFLNELEKQLIDGLIKNE